MKCRPLEDFLADLRKVVQTVEPELRKAKLSGADQKVSLATLAETGRRAVGAAEEFSQVAADASRNAGNR